LEEEDVRASLELLLWPAEAGDPVENLGVGTWAFGEPLERNFRVVFDRPAL
jgi:hypothetical protein